MNIEDYFLELAENDATSIRAKKCSSNFLSPSGVKAKTKPIETTGNDIWRTKVKPEQVQRILFLAESEKMSPPEIAASMADVSRTTVRRVLSQRAEARAPVPLTSSSRRSRGQRAQP